MVAVALMALEGAVGSAGPVDVAADDAPFVLTLEHVAGGFDAPMYVTNRLFVVERSGRVRVLVGGTAQEVLVQCFERRCLTHTPENEPVWQVEAGNVGRHYHQWRYEKFGE